MQISVYFISSLDYNISMYFCTYLDNIVVISCAKTLEFGQEEMEFPSNMINNKYDLNRWWSRPRMPFSNYTLRVAN